MSSKIQTFRTTRVECRSTSLQQTRQGYGKVTVLSVLIVPREIELC
jgi:hypothetical protein